MKKLLLIGLFIVGSLFADTIVFEQIGKIHTYDDVEFIKAGNGRVYFKIFGNEAYRDCDAIIEFTDDNGNLIDYDCSVVIDEPQNKGKIKLDNSHRHFIEAGEKLIKFRKKYYRGFLISFIGQWVGIIGAIDGEKEPMIAGGVISFAGALIMISSFYEAGESGIELIKAGEELAKEQSEDIN